MFYNIHTRAATIDMDRSPAVTKVAPLRPVLPFFEQFVPSSIHAWIAERVPWSDFQACKAVIDTMHKQARIILKARQEAVAKDDGSATRQPAEIKDLLSELRRSPRILPLSKSPD